MAKIFNAVGLLFLSLALFSIYIYLLDIYFPKGIIVIQIAIAILSLYKTRSTWFVAIGLYFFLILFMVFGSSENSETNNFTNFLFPLSHFLNYLKGKLFIFEVLVLFFMLFLLFTNSSKKAYQIRSIQDY